MFIVLTGVLFFMLFEAFKWLVSHIPAIYYTENSPKKENKAAFVYTLGFLLASQLSVLPLYAMHDTYLYLGSHVFKSSPVVLCCLPFQFCLYFSIHALGKFLDLTHYSTQHLDIYSKAWRLHQNKRYQIEKLYKNTENDFSPEKITEWLREFKKPEKAVLWFKICMKPNPNGEIWDANMRMFRQCRSPDFLITIENCLNRLMLYDNLQTLPVKENTSPVKTAKI